jgi:hypothetical protein
MTNLIEKIFLFLAIIISAVLIYLLAIDFDIISYKNIKSLAGEYVLATVYERQNTVKRRSALLPVWEDLSRADPLYEKEQVYTAGNSGAKLKFYDGTILDIGENSLVVLQKAMGLLSINVLKGEIYGSTTNKQGFQIITKKVKAIIRQDSKVQMQIVKDSPIINVISGSSSIEAENKVMELKKNETASIVEGQGIKVKEVLIELVSPEQNERHYFSKSIKLDFSWKTGFLQENKIDGLVLEISTDQDFVFILTKFIKIETAQERVKAELSSEGTYFWRVKAFSKAKDSAIYSNYRKLVLQREVPPVLLKPSNGEEISYEDKIKGRIIFAWEKKEEADSYQFNLSGDRSFSKDLIEKEIGFPPLSLEFFPSGTYYWRVRSVAYHGISDWSSINEFLISDVQLKFPEEGQSIYLPTNKDRMLFKWSALKGIKQYIFELSQSNDFATLLLQNKLSDSSFLWDESTVGHLYWRVKACDSKWNVLNTSATGHFVITRDKPKAPVIKQKYKLRIEE